MRVRVGQFLPPTRRRARAPSWCSAPSSSASSSAARTRSASASRSAPSASAWSASWKKGQFLGIDLDDAAYIPVARAHGELYKRDGLMEIALTYDPEAPPPRAWRRR
jgi:putative ABC transport system permease protein